MAITRFHIGISQPEDIIPRLAKKDGDWKEGYSAAELAHAWMNAAGFPNSVRRVLDSSPDYRDAELLAGIFEHEVDIRTRGRNSQTDLMVLAATHDGSAVIAVEGKVEETFGELVAKWNDGSGGKQPRLISLCTTLGLHADSCGELRYQLLHRCASAVYEAERFRYGKALMLVHSFSAKESSFADFQLFASALGIPVEEPNRLSAAKKIDGVRLSLGWVSDSNRSRDGHS